MIVEKMKSAQPMTEYTPSWDFSFGFKRWEDTNKIYKIKKWLIENEQMFITKFSATHDGGVGTGPYSVTGRFDQYNLFDYIDKCPELNDLLNFIRQSYLEFVYEEQVQIRDTELTCWYNILRKGQAVGEHHHGSGHDVYLSGNMSLDNYSTSTIYRCPYDDGVTMPITNSIGMLTLFPSCVPHYSNQYNGDAERISIAFDIRILGIEDERKLIMFMNETIFNQLVKN
jgi:hypothetical protein